MSGLFEEKIFGIPWTVVAVAAFALAVATGVLSSADGAEGPLWWLLRWGRSIAWLLLGASALTRSRVTDTPLETAAPLAAFGGLIYCAYIMAAP